jgi:hypothetical protein
MVKDTHYAKLMLLSPQPFNAVFHCNKFGAKDRGVNRGLSFGDPIDQGHIDKD